MHSFPETADTLLIDTYLADQAAASARVFRFYRPTPPHYHVHSDEYLYALSGRGTFWMGSPAKAGILRARDALVLQAGHRARLAGAY
jgi:mannose-6-phosphate isomerase-like protein (cupin superfamily)